MTKTIGRNTKHYREAMANAKNITLHTLSNSFNGVAVEEFRRFDVENGKVYLDTEKNRYTLHVHSNCWYYFTV